MGSGVSSSSSSSAVESSDAREKEMETFKALQNAYEASKELDDVELFNVLANVYHTSKEGTNHSAATPVGGVEVKADRVDNVESLALKEETPVDLEDIKERNKSFIVACGAFHKGNARADIGKAKALYEDGVDVNNIDADG